MTANFDRKKPFLGWREWAALPGLGVAAVNAKVDTGARSSALHAFDVEVFEQQGVERVRFCIHPLQRDDQTQIQAEAELLEFRTVRSSTGRETHRPVIRTPVCIGGREYPIELTLVNRDQMGFRMLLGRTALRRRFVVDPAKSYLAPPIPPASPHKH